MNEREQKEPSDDRTVHAFSSLVDIVRYDRSGKWYREMPESGLPRLHIGVNQAAREAVRRGFVVNYGLSGGAVFDRKVRALAVSPADTTEGTG